MFPFMYEGNTYNECTDAGNNGLPWCLTGDDGSWGECCGTPQGTTTEVSEGFQTTGMQCLVPPPCPAGHFSELGTVPCEPCEAGKYQPSTGKQMCNGCGLGRYCEEASTEESSCPAGHFCPEPSLTVKCTSAGSFCPADRVAVKAAVEGQCPAGLYGESYVPHP